ncbi:hypothetical protein JR316_0008749 [Psilocybe cubensis]|uniref:Uncharacterized protein n=1 Tax=Psilocybe cubensis TaxID=181762 RepID=A0ACB8GRK2_PSICU|nr:hypothetical protein JR316_0008749 [Psilocybe cubensis]KAH9478296.1 hypothetical protein JR316_0008749 [Psilocybe cubensis]
MYDSPPPIVYALPPESPSTIQYAPVKPQDCELITTPIRKKRKVSGPVKRTKVADRQGKAQNTEHTPGQQSTPATFTDFPEPNVLETSNQELEATDDDIDTRLLPNFDENYSLFLDAVLAEECGLFQLTSRLFVVNGWNILRGESTRLWYHVLRVEIDGIFTSVCLCPAANGQSSCFHSRFIDQNAGVGSENQAFEVEKDTDQTTFLFSRHESIKDGQYMNYFSTPSFTRFSTIKNRAVVEHQGDDTGAGVWKCNKDSGASSCSHIVSARHTLQQYLTGNCDAQDDNVGKDGDTGLQYNGKLDYLLKGIAESVSYRPLPPPGWSRVASDPPSMPRVTFDIPPTIISLSTNDSCCCTTPRERFKALEPTIEKECTIYTLTRAFKAVITLQKCGKCTHRCIGPDCSSQGIFNFNNRSLFTHELLDDYTSAFSSSETPFISWVQTVSRQYQARNSPIPFANEKLFRSSWFSYARLIDFGPDMVCPSCGPTPDSTIWDGVTVSFSRKNLMPTLRPPTTIGENSISRPDVRPLPNLQAIPNRSLRLLIRYILQGPQLTTISDATHPEGSPEYERNRRMVERLTQIPELVRKLMALDPSVGELFDIHFGMATVLGKRNAHDVYSKFFIQLSSDENVLQFIAFSCLDNLRTFIRRPYLSNVHLLRYIPALHLLIKHELTMGTLTNQVLGVCKWLYVRVTVVYTLLKVHDGPAVVSNVLQENLFMDDWLKTGCCYAMPAIRDRPQYPNLPYESGYDLGSAEIDEDICRKYYSTYSKKRLTGGIMCVWCTHSICYGFHCIRAAEGRNDVFSAIFTRWKKAPKVVVYDFACALQPYCMLREPDFFKDTLFAIDIFHSSEHKCGEACFLSSYCAENPNLLRLNSSAAECGNSGISKIRKAVSYMSQDRAVMYMRVFFSIWNRQQIQKLEKKQGH